MQPDFDVILNRLNSIWLNRSRNSGLQHLNATEHLMRFNPLNHLNIMQSDLLITQPECYLRSCSFVWLNTTISCCLFSSNPIPLSSIISSWLQVPTAFWSWFISLYPTQTPPSWRLCECTHRSQSLVESNFWYVTHFFSLSPLDQVHSIATELTHSQ